MQKTCILLFIFSLFLVTNAQINHKTYPETNTTNKLMEEFNDAISVKSFGAKGDGVNNDSAAIQSAINAAAVKKGTVFFVKGTYNISGVLRVDPYVKLLGENNDNTIIQTIKPVTALLVLSHTCISNIHIRGLYGNVTPTIGINSGSAEDVTIENNIIEYFFHGLNTGGYSHHWKISGNIVRYNKWDGIFIAAQSNYMHVTNNKIYANGSNGIDVNGSFNKIEFNTVDSNGYGFARVGYDGWGILVSAIAAGLPGDANNNIVRNNWIRKSCMQNIIIRADAGRTANYNVISNNTCIGSIMGTDLNSDGICIDGSVKGELTGNKITGNTVIGQRRHGIAISSWKAIPKQTVVSGNKIYNNNGYGLLLTGIETVAQDNTYLYNFKGDIHRSP